MASITLTRRQLYDLVWASPIETLAFAYGLSGRGLGKLCVRYRIPVPPRGYWAKKTAGKRVSQPPLPADDSPHRQRIVLKAPSTATSFDPPAREVHPLIAYEHDAQHKLSLSESLVLTNALVLKTQRLLRRAKRDANGLIGVPTGGLHIHTARDSHERALRITQALLNAFEERRFPIISTPEGFRISVLEEHLGFGIEEQLKTVEHRRTFTEQKLIERGLAWQVPKVDHIPADRLTLVITNVRHVRQRWSEDAQHPLEEMLNKFIIGLVRAALGVQQQRAEADRREQERQEEERKRQEEAKRLAEAEMRWREEQGSVERLEQLATIWRRNRRLRSLVASLEVAAGDVQSDSELGKWLAWARAHVNETDPLRHLRQRSGGMLTLYYHAWNWDHVRQEGFQEQQSSSYSSEKIKVGIELTCRPPRLTAYERALKVELPEDVVLPYEWAQDSDWYYANSGFRRSCSIDCSGMVPTRHGTARIRRTAKPRSSEGMQNVPRRSADRDSASRRREQQPVPQTPCSGSAAGRSGSLPLSRLQEVFD
jgi:hypothetical protein